MEGRYSALFKCKINYENCSRVDEREKLHGEIRSKITSYKIKQNAMGALTLLA